MTTTFATVPSLLTNRFDTPPIYVQDYIPDRRGILQRLVRWYDTRLPLPPIVKKIGFVVFSALATVTTAGLFFPMAVKLYRIHKEQSLHAAAALFCQQLNETIPTTLPTSPIVMKSSTRSFNHVNEYAIEDDHLWYRRRGTQEWASLFFDGASPAAISADGANLSVTDTEGKVHYRKVLSESHAFLSKAKRSFLAQPENSGAIERTAYFALDSTTEAAWQQAWFTMPIIGRISNLFTGKWLRVNNGAVSHRGSFSSELTDARNRVHLTAIGVSTLYELETGKHTFRLHDPWLPHWSKIRVLLPETENGLVIAENFDASAGTLFSIGYDIDASSGAGSLKILTNFVDIDSAGHNPGIPVSYQSNYQASEQKRVCLRRLLPRYLTENVWPELTEDLVLNDVTTNEGWIEHDYPEDARQLYNQISIVATGRSNADRELRIAGMNQEGKIGYFFKNITDEAWDFVENNSIDTSNPLERHANSLTIPEGVRRTDRYQGQNTDDPQAVSEAVLSNFGREYAAHPTLQLSFKSSTYDLPMHKRYGWKTFVGRVDEIYDLIIPESTVAAEDPLLVSFGRRRVIPLRVSVTQNNGMTTAVLRFSGRHPSIPVLKAYTAQTS